MPTLNRFSAHPFVPATQPSRLLRVGLCAFVLAFALGSAQAKIERTVEKAFPVTPGGHLKLNTYSGSVEVQPSADPTVKITLRQKIDASTDAEADEWLKKLELTFDATSSDVTIVAKYPNREGVRGLFQRMSWPPVQLTWKITVPSRYHVDVDTSGGSITIGDFQGDVKADTSGGSIKIGAIEGQVKANTSGGSITLGSASGAADLDTSGGSIRVGTVRSHARLDTSGGSISVAQAEHTVKADTSGGSIEVTFVGPIKGPSTLDTSGGSISVRVDANAAFDLAADTSAGGVTCELPVTVQGKMRRDKIVGKVNGGGPLLKLDTSAGSIRVLKR